jgi:Mor family transcriptional regulator
MHSGRKPKKQKQLSLEKVKQIIEDYDSGTVRGKIRRKYKITDQQVVSIIRNAINNNL